MGNIKNINNFYDYVGKFLYSSWTRSALSRIEVRNSDLFSETIAMTWCARWTRSKLNKSEYNEKEMAFYLYAGNLSYIPHRMKSYEYMEQKTNNNCIWEFQAENAINTLRLDNVFLSKDEVNNIYQLYKELYTNKFSNTLIGIVGLIIRVFIEQVLRSKKEKIDEIIEKAYLDMTNSNLEIMDLNKYYEMDNTPLTEDDEYYLDKIFHNEVKIKCYEYDVVSKEEYSDFIYGVKTVIPIKAEKGAIIKIKYDCLALEAKVTDELSEGCEIKTSERGQKYLEYYRIIYKEKDTGPLTINEELLLLLDKKIYLGVYLYEQFILVNEENDKKYLAKTHEYPNHVASHEELLKLINKTPKTHIKLEDIKEEDYVKGLLVTKVKIEEEI